MQLKRAFYYVIELRKCLKCILFPMWTYELKHLTIPLIQQSQGGCYHVVSGDVDTIALLSWGIDQGGIQDWAEHSVWWHSVVTRPLVPAAGAAPATGLRIDWAGVTSPGAWSPQTNTTNSTNTSQTSGTLQGIWTNVHYSTWTVPDKRNYAFNV